MSKGSQPFKVFVPSLDIEGNFMKWFLKILFVLISWLVGISSLKISSYFGVKICFQIHQICRVPNLVDLINIFTSMDSVMDLFSSLFMKFYIQGSYCKALSRCNICNQSNILTQKYTNTQLHRGEHVLLRVHLWCCASISIIKRFFLNLEIYHLIDGRSSLSSRMLWVSHYIWPHCPRMYSVWTLIDIDGLTIAS